MIARAVSCTNIAASNKSLGSARPLSAAIVNRAASFSIKAASAAPVCAVDIASAPKGAARRVQLSRPAGGLFRSFSMPRIETSFDVPGNSNRTGSVA